MGTSTGAELFVDTLESYGVEYVFGNPGTTELPVVNAFADGDVEYVLGLHEDVAVGAAMGYASTRRYDAHDDPDVCPVGVANLHIAPGLAHGLGNLYAAMHAGAPVVVTAGDYPADYRLREPILGGDLVGMAEPFTKWSAEVSDVESLPSMLRRAFEVATTPPMGPVFLSVPLDVALAETDARPMERGATPSYGGGDAASLERAAEVLVDADDPMLVVGDHVGRAGRDAVDAVVDLAEASGARVHSEVLASEMNFPVEHDQWVSPLPITPSALSERLDADAIAFVGCASNMPLLPTDDPVVPVSAECVFVGPDAWELGKNAPAAAALVGDPGTVASELASLVEDGLPEDERAARLERAKAAAERADERADTATAGVDAGDGRPSKRDLVDRLRDVVPDAHVVDEAVTTREALLARWPLEYGAYFSNKGGGLGGGLPAALGVALAESQREDPRHTLAVVGDGAYLYYPHAMYTAARYDLDLTVVVANNHTYRILSQNAAHLLGGTPEDYEFVGMDFHPGVDIARNAESHGAAGYTVETDADVEAAVTAAVEDGEPSVVDVSIHD